MNFAIILSGGIGSRMGMNIPKQYMEVQGVPLFLYSVDLFFNRIDIDSIIIGVADEWKNYVKEKTKKYESKISFAQSGETRQLSIYNALKEIASMGGDFNDIVVIHDAARPLISNDIVDACISGIKKEGFDGVLPVLPVKDTIYVSTDGISVTDLLNRRELYAGQSPESFLFGKYLQLHENLSLEELSKMNGSTEIAYKGNLHIKLIKGSEVNFKITTPQDLLILNYFLEK
jgi:2-C-methyl-D-erythritol 4-phosphate cytidylyltransferase